MSFIKTFGSYHHDRHDDGSKPHQSFVKAYDEVCGMPSDIQIGTRTLTYQEINSFFETLLVQYSTSNNKGLRNVKRNLRGMAELMIKEGFTLSASTEEGIDLVTKLEGIFIPRPITNVRLRERHSFLDRLRGKEPTYEIFESSIDFN